MVIGVFILSLSYDQALSLDPENIYLIIGKADLLRVIGKLEDALDWQLFKLFRLY